MALTNFYKGPEAEYSREKHINGIYMSTDSRKLWIFRTTNTRIIRYYRKN